MALTGDELVYVVGVQANGQPGATQFSTTTQDIANLGESGGDPTFDTITVDGASTLTGAVGIGADVTIATGKAIKTDTTTAHTALLQAYDVDGTAYKTFATLTNGNTPSFAIAAPAGGTVAIDGAVIGGSTPAAGTFTTLTATSSVPTALVGPPPTAGGSTITLTAAKAGQVTKLDTAAGTTVTLPAATGTGNRYIMVVSVAATSNAHKILAASSSDNIIGMAFGQNANTAKVFQAASASTYHSIQMPFAGTQPSGGLQGDKFEFIDVGTNLWHCLGHYSAGTTPTTPFNTATS